MVEIDVPLLARERGAELTVLLEAVPGVADVRGLGLLLAAELQPEALNGRTAAEVAAEVDAFSECSEEEYEYSDD